MVPSCRPDRVAPKDPDVSSVFIFIMGSLFADSRGSFAFIIFPVHEMVASMVSPEIETVPVAETPGQLSVEIVEIVIPVGVIES